MPPSFLALKCKSVVDHPLKAKKQPGTHMLGAASCSIRISCEGQRLFPVPTYLKMSNKTGAYP